MAGLAGGAVVAAVVAGPTAWAAVTSNPGPSTTYTGCLGTASGGIYNVAKGNVPLAACSGTDKQIKLAGGTITSVIASTGLTGGATKGDATLAVDPTWLAANATTGVTAGTGLTGGATSGPATLGIDPSYLSNNTTTGVSAGTGLTGGAPNGPASLAVDPAYRLPQGCSTGTMAVTNGSAWGCSTAQSKQFSFPSITTGTIVGATLGSIQLQLTCGTSTANVTVYADSAVGGSFNMAYANLSDSSSHDTGFNVSGTHTTSAVNNSGGTGSYVWDDANGNVITGNVTWYDPGGGGNCQFNGDLIQGAS